MKRLVIVVLILVGGVQAQTIPQVLQLQEPALPVVTNITANYVGGTPGVTTFYYWLVARYVVGNSTFSAPVAVNSVTSGVGSVVLSWVAPTVQTNQAATNNPGVALRYDVLRTPTASFPSNGNCVACLVANNLLALTTTDTFSVLSDYTSATYVPNVYSLSIDNTSSLLVGNSPVLVFSTNGIGSNILQWPNTTIQKIIPINSMNSTAQTTVSFMEFGIQKAITRFLGTTNPIPNTFRMGTLTSGGITQIISGSGIVAFSCDANQICTATNPIAGSPLSGTTGSIGGGLLVAGACATGTVAITGSTTSMTVTVSPAAGVDPTNGGVLGVSWDGRVSANGTVTVSVCTPIAGTPTAATYNVRVIQ